jgi:hypothetical protein
MKSHPSGVEVKNDAAVPPLPHAPSCLIKYNSRKHLPFYLFSYLWGLSGTESTITEAVYWPTLPALDDRW